MKQYHYYLGFLAFILLTPGLLHSQALPIKKEGKWGAINAEGETLIPAQYEFLSNFDSRGWAAFRKNGKAGLVTASGKELLPPKYEQVRPLSQKFIAIWEEGLCGIITPEQKEVIPPSFNNIDTLTASLLKVQLKGKYGVYNEQGEELLPATHQKMGDFRNGSYQSVITKDGKIGLLVLDKERSNLSIYPAVYDNAKENQFGEILLYTGNEITLVAIGESGGVAKEEQYTNQTAYRLAQEKQQRQQVSEQEQEPRKPRWTKMGFQYQLTNAFGQNLLGDLSFFNLSVDEEQGIAMGVAQQGEGEEAVDFAYIIQPDRAKILLKLQAKDLVVTDFRESEYARVTLDTLFDGLVNKKGELIEKVGGQDITNLGNFSDGLAYVEANGKYGFVNTQGELAIPLQYDIVSEFKNGYAVAKKNGKFGCLNTQGQTAVPFEYDGIGIPTEGVVRVKKGRGRNGKWGLIDLQNNQVAPFEYTVIGEFEDGEAVVRKGPKLGVINAKGKIVVPISIEADFLGPFQHGIAEIGMERTVEKTAGVPVVEYKRKGYVNREGSIVVPPKYNAIYDFDSVWHKGIGLAKVVVGNKMGYLDAKGNVAVPPDYTRIEGFKEAYMQQKGLAKVMLGDKFGYIDPRGNQVLAPAYSSVEGFEETLEDTTQLAQASIDGKYGYINHKEEPVIPMVYDLVSPVFGEAVVVQAKGRQGLLNTQGDTILPIEYQKIRLLEGSGKTLFLTYKAKAEQITFDASGEVKSHKPIDSLSEQKSQEVKLSEYQYLTGFNQYGVAVIADKEGLQGIANSKGEVLVKPDYKVIGTFAEGLAPFKVDHRKREKQLWGYLNTQGEEVIDAEYDMTKRFGNDRGLVLQRQWGYINKEGKMVLPPEYRQAEPFSGGYALVNQNQIIDVDGKVQGEFLLEGGQIIQGFSSDRAIAEVPSGQLHIRPNGQPAYYAAYDEVTPYFGDIAFVKKGEEWTLTRSIKGREVQIPFSKAGMRAYKREYGKRDKKTTKEGIDIKDVKWTKTKEGVWRMIDAQGYFVGKQLYQSVEADPVEREFRAEVPGLVGLVNLKGEVLLPAEQEQIQYMEEGVIQVAAFGSIGYLRPDGTWLYEPK